MTTEIATVTFRYSHTIGRQEAAGPGFSEPVAMALGEGGRMYVVSRSGEYRPDRRRVTICTVDEEYLGEFASGGLRGQERADAILAWPTSICVDREGMVHVADEWFNRISVFTREGEWVGNWGAPGRGDGELNRPSGIAFDQQDNLYVVDSLNHRVEKFTQDGKFILKWGSEGTEEGEFNLPWGIDVDANGDVYVADWGNDRVQKFASSGQFLMKFGTQGAGDGQFNRPSGVAVDKDGLLYVADWGNDRVQVLDRDGRFVTQLTGDATVSKWGKEKLDANPDMWQQRDVVQFLEREKFFWGPIAVEVDNQGRVFVVDCARHRVQVYRKIAPYFLGLYDNGRL